MTCEFCFKPATNDLIVKMDDKAQATIVVCAHCGELLRRIVVMVRVPVTTR